MKRIKSENGAITILVLTSILFMVSFLISTYVIVANKIKTQKEIINEIRKTYEAKKSLEEIYNSYFNTGNIIPIYNVEQLMMIGEVHNNININGKYYNFNNDEDTIYMLMDNIEFNAEDFAQAGTVDKWKNVNFYGNSYTITVTYEDSENAEYTIVYSEENNYQEPIYKVEIKVFTEQSVDVTESAEIYIRNGEQLTQIEQDSNGKYIIDVTRLEETTIVARLTNYSDAQQVIYIENPNKKDSEINLTLAQ